MRVDTVDTGPGIPTGVPGPAALPENPWEAAWTPRDPGPTQLDAVDAWERRHQVRRDLTGVPKARPRTRRQRDGAAGTPPAPAVVPTTVSPARRRHPIRRLLGVLGAVVLALATTYWWYAGTSLFVARGIPAINGWGSVAVVSGSMEPTLSPGDVIGYEPYDGRTLAPGAIIVFTDPARPDTLMTHRVVGALGDGRLQTRGDANRQPDSTPVDPDAVVGVARMVAPGAGLPFYWLETGRTRTFALWAMLSVVALMVMLVAPADRPDGRGRRRRGALRPALVTLVTVALVGGAVTISRHAGAAFADTTPGAGSAFAAFRIAHLGSIGEATCGGTSSTITVPTPVAASDLVVIRVRLRDPTGSVATSASDARGNAYTVDVEGANGNRARVAIISARLTTALHAGDTITVTHRNNRASAVTADVFRGIAAVDRVAATNTYTGNATAASVSASVPDPHTLVIGTVATQNGTTISTPGGWTSLDTGDIACNRVLGWASAWADPGEAGSVTYDPTFSDRRHYAAAVVAYRSATP